MEVMAASGTKGSLCRPTKTQWWPSSLAKVPISCYMCISSPRAPPYRSLWQALDSLWRVAGSILTVCWDPPQRGLIHSGCFSLTHTFKEAWADEEAEAQKGPRRDFAKPPSKPWAEADSVLELRFLGSRPRVERNLRARQVS